QAEDGIRDRNVTGVQTCALPIYPRNFGRPRRIITVSLSRMAEDDTSPSQQPLTGAPTKPRMVVPDVARGLALLGIAIANLPTAWLTPGAPEAAFFGSINNVFDQILVVASAMFAHNRGLPLF